MTGTSDDPRGLIREAYRMEGIEPGECRTIFLDWALSLPDGADPAAAASRLLATGLPQDHPMSRVLAEAQSAPAGGGRRGGRKGRHGDGA